MVLLKSVRDSSEEHVAWLGTVYLGANMRPSRRARVLDALLEHGSAAAQRAVITMVRLTGPRLRWAY
jgi:hypothetical protein